MAPLNMSLIQKIELDFDIGIFSSGTETDF